MFGFLRAITRYIERLLSHKTTFTMLRDVRVQFLEKLIPVVPDVYRKFNSSDLISRMISRVGSLTKHLFKSVLSTRSYRSNCHCVNHHIYFLYADACIIDSCKYDIDVMDRASAGTDTKTTSRSTAK